MRNLIVAGLIVLAAGITAPERAVSDPLNDIAGELRAQGYRVVDVRKTWLGRIRISAETEQVRREVVFDRVTGEIRRDLVEEKTPEAGNAGKMPINGSRRPAVTASRPNPVAPILRLFSGDEGKAGAASNGTSRNPPSPSQAAQPGAGQAVANPGRESPGPSAAPSQPEPGASAGASSSTGGGRSDAGSGTAGAGSSADSGSGQNGGGSGGSGGSTGSDSGSGSSGGNGSSNGTGSGGGDSSGSGGAGNGGSSGNGGGTESGGTDSGGGNGGGSNSGGTDSGGGNGGGTDSGGDSTGGESDTGGGDQGGTGGGNGSGGDAGAGESVGD